VLSLLEQFLAELRAGGIPISVREAIDATVAVREVGFADRAALRGALAATLVKSPEHRQLFLSTFEIYFSRRSGARVLDDLAAEAGDSGNVAPPSRLGEAERGKTGAFDPDSLAELASEALRSGDADRLGAVARFAVALFAGVEPSRPVGVSYYLHRTLRGLDLEGLIANLVANGGADDALEAATAALGELGQRVRAEEFAARAESLRGFVEDEIRRLLVEARGAASVAKTLRRPLLDDVDFIAATRDELAEMRRAIAPIARVLASRLARRRRHRRRGPLDFRRTIRRSLSTGGVPLEPRFKSPHPVQPEIFVLADVSGSVAAFARFTVHLVYAISSQFSKVRSAVFIDNVDEVTELFRRSGSFAEAIERIALEAEVVRGDGHSDYGAAFRGFAARYAKELTGRTNLIILGDARNNYHLSEAGILEDLGRRAHRVLWLNPEPKAYWGSGDSIIDQYAPFCDGVFECRNLGQLKAFVDELA
jgi:hypothetical protein